MNMESILRRKIKNIKQVTAAPLGLYYWGKKLNV